ncbi:MAG: carboxylating nicotinate-nucleotide diphosphorylase [Candidatus Krumholzibacteria bacterium]|nr:carboxylating nicotinate-nucleotide diphosphorylase [Candidatus Krumholzibacteria bacterium]
MTGIEETLSVTVKAALDEDRAFDDITTSLLVPRGMMGEAVIIAREDGVISGQLCARTAFELVDGGLEYLPAVPDGKEVNAGEKVATIRGRLASILSAERTALNLLGHLSGVATLTSKYVGLISGSGVSVLDTRKTLPGLRQVEKQAVVDGGGKNHRPDLASYILVKENHIAAAGGIASAAALMGEKLGESEIEVTSIEELRELEQFRPSRVMLDNFEPGGIRDAISLIDGWEGERPEIEVSGGITLDNIGSYSIEGVDFISTGSITASARALDLSLLVSIDSEWEQDGHD